MQILIQKCIKNGWPQDEEPCFIDDALLEYSEGELDNDHEHTTWQEWKLEGKIVKRGAHVRLKQNVVIDGIAAMLS